MLNLSKEKLLIIIALSLAGISLAASIVLGLQVIKLKQDLASQSFPVRTSTPTPRPNSKPILSPTPATKISPFPTPQTKMPWENSVCGNGICEPCESRSECCNYPCITDAKGSLMCPPPTCLGHCSQDCQDTPITTPEKDCAVNGESPTNFDMTTGKIIPGGKPCCDGLKAIGPKTPQDALDKGACMHKMGTVGVCRPCGDGICNPEYEDRCNCPEDCR